MPVVWAGVNFSSPGTLTGTSFPASSTCGGRPGEKIRSLTLLDIPSICRSTTTKFGAADEVCGSVGFASLILVRTFLQDLASNECSTRQSSRLKFTSKG